MARPLPLRLRDSPSGPSGEVLAGVGLTCSQRRRGGTPPSPVVSYLNLTPHRCEVSGKRCGTQDQSEHGVSGVRNPALVVYAIRRAAGSLLTLEAGARCQVAGVDIATEP